MFNSNSYINLVSPSLRTKGAPHWADGLICHVQKQPCSVVADCGCGPRQRLRSPRNQEALAGLHGFTDRAHFFTLWFSGRTSQDAVDQVAGHLFRLADDRSRARDGVSGGAHGNYSSPPNFFQGHRDGTKSSSVVRASQPSVSVHYDPSLGRTAPYKVNDRSESLIIPGGSSILQQVVEGGVLDQWRERIATCTSS